MNAPKLPISAPALREWLIRYITAILDLPAENFPTSQVFTSYGLDSVEVVVMAGVLEEEFGVPLDPVHLFEYPTVDAAAAALAADPA
jgi:acyl carrier protein